MVKKGEKGVPRSAETRVKIGAGARITRMAELRPCPEGCEGLYNNGNMASHVKKYHTFVCKVPKCPDRIAKGLGYCVNHYRLHAFCVKLGVTLDYYFEAYEEQGGLCKICNRFGEMQCTGKSKLDVLVVDHCHTAMTFRGLICYKCNLGLGHFQDNLESLRKAIDYLEGTL